MKQRIVMVVEFDGSCFHGWQRQDNAVSVQGVLEDVLGKIEGDRVSMVAAGRTDAGVHAEALPVHVDISRQRWQRSPKAYTQGVNQLLPPGLRVTGVKAVDENFHARFDCLERRYCYKIWNRSTSSALHQWRHWWMPRKMDVAALEAASACLLGRQDFTSFRASGCQAASAVREIRYIGVRRHGWEYIIDIHADAFLYHMVRNIVGSLAMVATGKWDGAKLQQVLHARDRSIAGATAPAHGLYFTDALYSDFAASEVTGRELP